MKSDNQIQLEVMEEIGWDPMLNANDIGVSVRDGVVTLSGNVTSYPKKLAAEKAAKRIKDVRGVAMDLEVRLGFENQRNDTEIARAAVDALRWSSVVPDEKVKVKAEDGWITLEGEVPWQFQKVAAFNAVHHLVGVKGVSNLITLSQTVNIANVQNNIRKALERNADIEANRIRIGAKGSTVTLSGAVNSWTERSIAERAAWSSPGVTTVNDELLIGE